jgi:hypothetical protein
VELGISWRFGEDGLLDEDLHWGFESEDPALVEY